MGEEEIVYEVVITRQVTRQKTGKGYYNVRDDKGAVEQQYIESPVGIMETEKEQVFKQSIPNLNIAHVVIFLNGGAESV